MSDRPVEFEITSRARQYGYVIWPKRRDPNLRELLGERERIDVVLNGRSLGERRVDWKYRRISVGPTATWGLGEDQNKFLLDLDAGKLSVSTA